MHPKKVGRKYENQNFVSYCDCNTDYDGWIKTADFLPEDYDLCRLKMENGRTHMGWSTGGGWDGANVKQDDKVIYWKRSVD
jgi:hypothetical protein